MNENTEEYKYELDTWEGGTLVTPAKVDLTTGIVTPAVYSGNTPITPERLEIMNQGIKKLYEEGAISKDIYIGPEETAPEEAKIIIDDNLMKTKASEVVNSLEGNEINLAPSVRTVNNEFTRIKGQILWANPNPTNNFDAQTITLSSDDYDILEWYYLYNNDLNQKVMKCEKVPKGYSPQLELIYGSGTIRRICDYVSDTSYSIRNNVGAGNEYIIPLYIIGHKTGLFSEEVSINEI